MGTNKIKKTSVKLKKPNMEFLKNHNRKINNNAEKNLISNDMKNNLFAAL